MLKYLKASYNFLMKLKQYHAVHVIVIPPSLFFLISYCIVAIQAIPSYVKDNGNLAFWILGFIIIYLGITYFSFFLAIIVELIILIIQTLNKEKIYTKSKFLLNNKIYNILYLFSLTNYILLALISLFKLGTQEYLTFIYLFPFNVLYSFIKLFI